MPRLRVRRLPRATYERLVRLRKQLDKQDVWEIERHRVQFTSRKTSAVERPTMNIHDIPLTDSAKPGSVRTRSVPTAAALMLAGHRPVCVLCHDSSGAEIVFPPEARDTRDKFLTAKQIATELIARGDRQR